MKQRLLRHLKTLRSPEALDGMWSQEKMPTPEQSMPSPTPQQPAPQGGGGTIGKTALDSFLPSANQELNPEVPLEEMGVAPGSSPFNGRFSDAAKRKRNGMQSLKQRGELTYG